MKYILCRAGGTHSNIDKPNKRKIHTNTLFHLGFVEIIFHTSTKSFSSLLFANTIVFSLFVGHVSLPHSILHTTDRMLTQQADKFTLTSSSSSRYRNNIGLMSWILSTGFLSISRRYCLDARPICINQQSINQSKNFREAAPWKPVREPGINLSSPIRVRDKAPATNAFWCELENCTKQQHFLQTPYEKNSCSSKRWNGFLAFKKSSGMAYQCVLAQFKHCTAYII